MKPKIAIEIGHQITTDRPHNATDQIACNAPVKPDYLASDGDQAPSALRLCTIMLPIRTQARFLPVELVALSPIGALSSDGWRGGQTSRILVYYILICRR